MQFINGDRGKNYPSKDKLSSEGIPFISAVNLSNGTVSQENLLCVSEAQYQKLGSGKLEKNDLVFCIRGSLGKKAIYPFDIGAIASSLVILRRYLKEETFLYFVDIYMSSPFLFEEIRKYDNGTAQPNLSANNFMCFRIPLPPSRNNTASSPASTS
jgi:type I restriction enzyme S subunit